jgi:two-component system response regulator FixJ
LQPNWAEQLGGTVSLNLPQEATATPSPSQIVYIVDDDDHVRNSTVALLKAAGIANRAYESGGAFLSALDASAGGCVLLDLHMPNLSGFQILASMRERGSTLPVILFSGRADSVTEELAKQSGAVALLCKPIAPAQLVSRVREILAGNALG